jgi:hypothetical protein
LRPSKLWFGNQELDDTNYNKEWRINVDEVLFSVTLKLKWNLIETINIEEKLSIYTWNALREMLVEIPLVPVREYV